ncbi:MAG: hypothetical protein K6C95_11210 [Lachnospiraceae bacterium]|nr:hypothetical protein [Lachnospiraceae bacterium]
MWEDYIRLMLGKKAESITKSVNEKSKKLDKQKNPKQHENKGKGVDRIMPCVDEQELEIVKVIKEESYASCDSMICWMSAVMAVFAVIISVLSISVSLSTSQKGGLMVGILLNVFILLVSGVAAFISVKIARSFKESRELRDWYIAMIQQNKKDSEGGHNVLQ